MLALLAGLQCATSREVSVDTSFGQLNGTAVAGVEQFFGVPFAVAPVSL
jgi:carboxylesterase type B